MECRLKIGAYRPEEVHEPGDEIPGGLWNGGRSHVETAQCMLKRVFCNLRTFREDMSDGIANELGNFCAGGKASRRIGDTLAMICPDGTHAVAEKLDHLSGEGKIERGLRIGGRRKPVEQVYPMGKQAFIAPVTGKSDYGSRAIILSQKNRLTALLEHAFRQVKPFCSDAGIRDDSAGGLIVSPDVP